MEVKGRVAVVTGSSSGVGSEVAVQLAQLGARVVINYVNTQTGAQDTLARVQAAGGEGIVVKGDVSLESDCLALVDAAVDHFGQLDILVNNAGTTTHIEHKQLDALSDEVWRRTLDTNVMGPFYMTRAAAKAMEQQGGGEVVMTSSIAGLTTNGSSIAYCCSKAALNSMTRTLAKALGEKNIRVNAICPGLIDGRWGRAGWGENWDAVKAFTLSQSPIARLTTPEDVADSILSVITGTDLMTGQLITLDSGFTI